MRKSNLASALAIAIESRVAEEKKLGYTRDSAFVGGLRDILRAIELRQTIEIVE
jgi:hypothetical protein